MYRPVLPATSPPPPRTTLPTAVVAIPRLVPERRSGGSALAFLLAACLVVPRQVRERGSRGSAFAALLVAMLTLPLAAAGPVAAQEEPDDPIARATSALRFRTIGPTIMGGRVSELAVVESDPSTFYVGVASGGVWKTENAGITFEHVFRDESTASVGAVAVAPSNPNVVWVGTGEPNNRQSSPWGNGVYRSTDAGRTWTHLGLENTHHIGRIQVHPRDPDVAYVAAVGHLWGPNPERGVYRTTDGGESWELVLFVDEDTGAIDLAMDMADPKTIFAAMYQRRRRAWGFNGGGPGSGIHRTIDGGDTWTELTEGLPEGDKGRIGLDIYRGDGNLVFALVEADARGPGQGGRGARSRTASTAPPTAARAGSTSARRTTGPCITATSGSTPTTRSAIYLGGCRASTGPRTEGRASPPTRASGVHPDHHALWIDPVQLRPPDPRGRRRGLGQLGPFRQLVPAAQPADRAVIRDRRGHAGSLPRLRRPPGQRLLVRALRTRWSNQGIRTRDWYNVGGGDGFFTVMHSGRPGHHVRRVAGRVLGAGQPRERASASLDPARWPGPPKTTTTAGRCAGTGTRRSCSRRTTTGSCTPAPNILFRSPDLGQSWEEISPDLTWNDRPRHAGR